MFTRASVQQVLLFHDCRIAEFYQHLRGLRMIGSVQRFAPMSSAVTLKVANPSKLSNKRASGRMLPLKIPTDLNEQFHQGYTFESCRFSQSRYPIRAVAVNAGLSESYCI